MRRAAMMVLIAAMATTFPARGCALVAQGRVIHADGPPVWGTDVRLVPSFTVGSVDGPPEYAFGSVDRVVGEKSGGFFVHDSKYAQVRRYDPSGKLMANIGRKGSGPGEYQQLLGMAILGDSVLVTWDPPNARATFFGLDGKVRSSFMAVLGGVSHGPDVFGLDNSGIISLQVGIRGTRGYIRYRANGSALDTLPAVVDDGNGFMISTADGPRYSLTVGRVIKPNTSGGLIAASTDTLGFAVTGVTNPFRVVRHHVPVRVGASERKEWEALAEIFHKLATAQRPQPGVQRMEPALAKIPTMKPAFRDLRSDRDGRIWLEVYTPAEQRSTPTGGSRNRRPQISWLERSTFEVFASSGQYLGRIALPAEHQLLDARGDRVWTYAQGPDGEETIVVFQIVRK